jgi:glycine C-acetyltransferase
VVAGEKDVLLVDEKSHASIFQGCGLSKAKILTYKHNDMKNLEKLMKNETGNKMVVTDGVFSMDGDLASLDEIYNLTQKYNAGVYVDDAHGFGVVGATGRGTHEHFNLVGKIDLMMGTLAKALCVQGGYIVGKKKIIDYLRYTTPSFMFNVSLQPYFVAGALTALNIIKNESKHRLKLWENVNYVKENLQKLGFVLSTSGSSIISICVGDTAKTSKVGHYLLEQKDLILDAVFYPIVKKKEAKIRVVLNASHTRKDLEKLIEAFKEAKKLFDLI